MRGMYIRNAFMKMCLLSLNIGEINTVAKQIDLPIDILSQETSNHKLNGRVKTISAAHWISSCSTSVGLSHIFLLLHGN